MCVVRWYVSNVEVRAEVFDPVGRVTAAKGKLARIRSLARDRELAEMNGSMVEMAQQREVR